jgi:hypothetical protein
MSAVGVDSGIFLLDLAAETIGYKNDISIMLRQTMKRYN